MLSRLRNMFRVPDLRNKIFFTIFIVLIYRLGTHIPVPYVDYAQIKALQDSSTNSGVVGFLDLFSGGAITSVSVFFLGIMPYITASIIMQLLGVVIPKLEQWQQEGQTGQKKITQWTRYVTVGLALLQSSGLVIALHEGKQGLLQTIGFQGKDMIPHYNGLRAALIVLTWVAGTALVMWLGELITQRGIGNGMSIIIFASVVSRLPAQGGAIFAEGGWFKGVVIILIGIAMFNIALNFAQAGCSTGFIRWMSRHRALDRQDLLRATVIVGLVPVVLVSSLLAVVLYLAAHSLAPVFSDAKAVADVARVFQAMAPFVDFLGRPLGMKRRDPMSVGV